MEDARIALQNFKKFELKHTQKVSSLHATSLSTSRSSKNKMLLPAHQLTGSVAVGTWPFQSCNVGMLLPQENAYVTRGKKCKIQNNEWHDLPNQ